ncbi:hypothetical protein TWF970_006102 [Orbilia oligospora]|uniref:Uncharacterized protein n=1 Tax=Orbilia oligospora TaxID=2813651 RepID=A0A7C8VD00_ORBOL|nr:hypothetical protein TWF970_006102 [Orbilia oligospora]
MSDYANYTVGWICAIRTEYVAAQAFLDENFGTPEFIPPGDNNHYTLGRIGKHNVVIAVLPDGGYGLSSAAAVIKDVIRSFPNLRIGLMVGVGGGAPSRKNDIRLGDIVVSSPRDGHGGVFQYDFGKVMEIADTEDGTSVQRFQETGFLAPPPVFLRTAVNGLGARYELQGHQIEEAIGNVLQKNRKLNRKYKRPQASSDRLYRSDAIHPSSEGDEEHCIKICGNDASKLVARPERDEDEDNPAIHYGLIASANCLMKNATVRDQIAAKKGALCFEMEAAGLVNQFPCLVIRGICDYSDSHKNKEWQGYASMTAAAYAKDLLNEIAPSRVEAETRISEIPGILSSIEKTTSKINASVQVMGASLGNLTTKQHQAAIKAWLSPSDCSTNYNKAIRQRHKGTGSWLLESDNFDKWKTDRNSFLWLHGIMGCGKTILSSTVIENLSSCRPLVYFYFDITDGDKQTFDKMIRSLLYQLYYQSSQAPPPQLEELFHSCEDGNIQPTSLLLSQTFLSIIEKTEEIWIVLDALDECNQEERAELLSWMKGIRTVSERKNVHLLVTSRSDKNDIESGIRKLAHAAYALEIKSSLTTTDISAYIRWRVREDDGLERWRAYPDIQDEMEAELQRKSDGMFRWVACQLDAVSSCLDLRQLRQTLRSLPKTLDETYARILHGIPEDYKKSAIKILQFLTYSRRHLWIEEVIDVVAVDLDESPHFDPKYRMPNQNEILCYCSSLVTTANVYTGRTQLQLAHASVKEYLLSNRLDDQIAPNFQIFHANASISKICLTYILHLDLPEPMNFDKDSSIQVLKAFPLASYSAMYWMEFAIGVEAADQDLQGLLEKLFYDKRFYQFCYNLYKPEPQPYRNPMAVEQISKLYYASACGLRGMVGSLISAGSHLNAFGEFDDSALFAASICGHCDVVEILLANGADVNKQEGYFGSPLHAASRFGYVRIVKLLLANGANINAQGGISSTALEAASSANHVEVVELLLENGADIHDRGGYFYSALAAASSYGHDDVVKLLLKNGADVDQGYPLERAASHGHKKVVEILLENGADVSIQGKEYGGALRAASSRGHANIVELLLKRGADVNAESVWGNALEAASTHGHHESVELLVANGANIDQSGALHAASSCGHERIVETLIRQGADVNAQFGVHGSALQAASSCGYDKVAKLLLINGADVNAQNSMPRASQNALAAAVSRGHEKVVELLLKNGADISESECHDRLIQIASIRGHLKVVEILLANGSSRVTLKNE